MSWRGLIDYIHARLADRRGEREIAHLRAASPDIAAAAAREAATTASELQTIAGAGSHAAHLRQRMIEAFGIQSDDLSHAAFGALRQTGVTCSHCRSKRRCAVELARGTARTNAADFCPNATTFDALVSGSRR